MLGQIVEITLMNLRNVPSRLGSSSVIVVGIGGVVLAVVRIPKSVVLSVRSVAFAEHIPYVPYGHEAHLGLAVAVYSEL